MKRLTLILGLSVLMALAISAATYAAATITATGDATFRTAIAENEDGDYQLQGNWRTRANLRFDAGSGNITARAMYIVRRTGFESFPNVSTGTGGGWDTEQTDAYVNIRGAFLPGTPTANLRVGRFSTNVNRWIGNFGRRQGLHLSALNLGPVTTNVYHGWENANRTLTALTAQAKVDIVDLDAAFVYYKDIGTVPDHQETNLDFVVSASAKPVTGVTVAADFAQNGLRKRAASGASWAAKGTDPATAWKVDGELATIPNFTLNASIWHTDDNFRPVYRQVVTVEHLDLERKWTNDNDRAGIAWGDPWIADGFSIGAKTTQAGLPINATFKTGKIFGANLPGRVTDGTAAVGATGSTYPDNTPYYGKTMNVFGIDTTIVGVGVDVALTMIEDLDPVTDIIVTRSVQVAPLGGNVALRGTFRLQDEEFNYGADATWRAPNGLTLGVHYANYDRVTDWNHNNSDANLSEGVNIGKPGEADGFAITAGYQLNF